MKKHLRHTVWKITTVISLICAILSMSLAGYMVYRHNKFVDAVSHDVFVLRELILTNEELAISVYKIMNSNDLKILERLSELEERKSKQNYFAI